MLKRLFVGLYMALFLSLKGIYGVEVPKEVALDYAYKFFAKQKGIQNITVKNIDALSLNDSIYSWVINFNPSGWILIASDDKVKPVIAFSFSDSFNVKGLKKLPFNFWFEKNYGKQILGAKHRTNLLRNKEWDTNFKLKSTSVSVDPFIPVKWNQGNGWNIFCPVDAAGPGGHAYVGCVAVAMGQAMSVFKYPAKGIGTHGYTSTTYGYLSANYGNTTYSWNLMDNNSANQYNALLLYHLGVAVDMNYGADGSGALSSKVSNALKAYFGYSKDVIYRNKSAYTEAQWVLLIKKEIDAGRPVYYSGDPGTGESGHAFNIDGYFDDSFHFNWGWSGSYNGYFSLTNLNPGSYNFSVNQAAVIGIGLLNNAPTDVLLSNNSIKEGLSVNSFVGKVSVIDNSPDDYFTYILKGPWSPIDDEYTITPFIIRNDSLLSTEVFSYSTKNSYEINMKVTDKEMNTIEKQFFISVQRITSTSKGVKPENRIGIFPNPVKNKLYLSGDIPNDLSICIYSVDGLKKAQYNNYKKAGIDLEELALGVYVIKISCYNKVYEIKLVKQ